MTLNHKGGTVAIGMPVGREKDKIQDHVVLH